MFDKIITISVNPALDVTLWTETMDFSEPNKTTREEIYAAGKSINVSRVLASLQTPSVSLGICGDDNSKPVSYTHLDVYKRQALEQPDAQVTAVEKSPAAFSYLTKNNERLGTKAECLLGDALTLETVDGPFDLIVSNPPYLTGQDMAELQVEVRFEPAVALYGEDDGLYFYRELTKIYVQRLRPGGMLAYEIGEGQQDAVSELLAAASLKSICQIPDYNGIIRCITGKKL